MMTAEHWVVLLVSLMDPMMAHLTESKTAIWLVLSMME